MSRRNRARTRSRRATHKQPNVGLDILETAVVVDTLTPEAEEGATYTEVSEEVSETAGVDAATESSSVEEPDDTSSEEDSPVETTIEEALESPEDSEADGAAEVTDEVVVDEVLEIVDGEEILIDSDAIVLDETTATNDDSDDPEDADTPVEQVRLVDLSEGDPITAAEAFALEVEEESAVEATLLDEQQTAQADALYEKYHDVSPESSSAIVEEIPIPTSLRGEFPRSDGAGFRAASVTSAVAAVGLVPVAAFGIPQAGNPGFTWLGWWGVGVLATASIAFAWAAKQSKR